MLSQKEVEAIFKDCASDETGLLALNDLHKVVSQVNLPANAQALVLVQGALRELYDGGDIEDGIPFALFYTWYKIEVTPGAYEKHNELLVRRVVGKVKLPTRRLQNNNFTYGEKNTSDPEGAGEVVLSWAAGKLSESKEAGVSLLKVNKAVLKKKLLTPKEVNRFLQENKNAPKLQKPKIVGRKKDRGPKRDPNVVYGESNSDEHEDIHQTIFKCGDNDVAFEHYVDTSGQVQKGKLPKPRPTKCSELLKSKIRTEIEQKESSPEPWKMTKFSKNAKPRVNTFNSPNNNEEES